MAVSEAAAQEAFSLERVEHNLDVWGFFNHQTGDPLTWHLNLFGMPFDLQARVMVFTWVSMGLVLLLAFIAARGAGVRRSGKMATMFELMFGFLADLVYDSMGKRRGQGILCLIIAYFLFITIANFMGLVPLAMAPTADPNTTFGLALITFAMIFIWGIRYKGGGYFKHYLKPFPVFLPITIIEDLAKPLTLAFRLYGNMRGKEVMIVALLGLITGVGEICGGFLASVVWLAFGVFVSLIQAFVFTMLSIAYISMAVAEDH